jgi:dTDP-4-dehydrorhamnose reductase
MKPRILLTGKNGQVGAELAMVLPGLGEVIAPDREELDLSRPDEIRRTIREIRPSLIVNAAAYTAVDQAEKEEALAQAINADAPALMAQEASKIGAGLVHYSTDYVFDGSKHSPYEENDPPNPVSVYGRTKLAGEQAIRDAGLPYLIFRTAWVYGTRGRNFLLTILRLASQREELRIVRDQIGTPTWCREIARGTASVLGHISQDRKGALSLPEAGGVYHMTAAGVTTWYDFAEAILDEASHDHDRRVPNSGSPPGLFCPLEFPTRATVRRSIARLAHATAFGGHRQPSAMIAHTAAMCRNRRGAIVVKALR